MTKDQYITECIKNINYIEIRYYDALISMIERSFTPSFNELKLFHSFGRYELIMKSDFPIYVEALVSGEIKLTSGSTTRWFQVHEIGFFQKRLQYIIKKT